LRLRNERKVGARRRSSAARICADPVVTTGLIATLFCCGSSDAAFASPPYVART